MEEIIIVVTGSHFHSRKRILYTVMLSLASMALFLHLELLSSDGMWGQ